VSEMRELRCKNCGKVLAMVNYIDAAIKCHKCYMIYEYKIFPNLAITNQIDPNKHLRDNNDSAIIKTES